MHGKFPAALALALAVGSSALAADDTADSSQYLNRIESVVFEATGDHQAIAKRGATCIAQIAKPGLVNAPIIVSSDFDAGVIVANNNFKFSIHGFLGVALEETGRTTLTLQAKDGRFRIVHTSIEQFIEYPGSSIPSQGWSPVYTAAPNASDFKTTVDEISQKIADCVKADPSKDSNW